MSKYLSLFETDQTTHVTKMSDSIEAQVDTIIKDHLIPFLNNWTTPVATSFGTLDKVIVLHEEVTEFTWHNYMFDTANWEEFAEDLKEKLGYTLSYTGERNRIGAKAILKPASYPKATPMEALDYLS